MLRARQNPHFDVNQNAYFHIKQHITGWTFVRAVIIKLLLLFFWLIAVIDGSHVKAEESDGGSCHLSFCIEITQITGEM